MRRERRTDHHPAGARDGAAAPRADCLADTEGGLTFEVVDPTRPRRARARSSCGAAPRGRRRRGAAAARRHRRRRAAAGAAARLPAPARGTLGRVRGVRRRGPRRLAPA
ncbi:hypothetical protein NKH77_12505 [Streptomyces sp. M19]